jgi:hypothetical protein
MGANQQYLQIQLVGMQDERVYDSHVELYHSQNQMHVPSWRHVD